MWSMFGGRPDLRIAAKQGKPAMTPMTPSTPVGISATVGLGPTAEVEAETISGPSKLDTEPDARKSREASEPSEPPR